MGDAACPEAKLPAVVMTHKANATRNMVLSPVDDRQENPIFLVDRQQERWIQ
jgi:hypothetical protein